ncbi:MAG: haloalkane dehalogenase [Bacteroidota bacterium]
MELTHKIIVIMKVNMFPLVIMVITFLVAACQEEEVSSELPPEASIDTLVTPAGIQFVRTPDAEFENLPDWPYPYQYVEIDGLRQAYAEAGPADGEVVLLLHGQPSWSYLYRKMMPVLADAGYRVIAMDHLGFGRSDKPLDIDDYSYLGHYDRIERFIEMLNLRDIHFFGQDWGSVLGLRVVGLHPDWFKTVTIGNGNLPNVPAGQQIYPPVENPEVIEDIPSIFTQYTPQQVPYFDNCVRLIEVFDFPEWMVYTMKSSNFTASEVLEGWTWFDLPPDVEAAYDAPFPNRTYMAGARKFPSILNEVPGLTQEAWAGLASFQKPFFTIWGANDPLDLGECQLQQALIDNIPGADGLPHHRFPDASHYLQEDQGAEIARRMIEVFRSGGESDLRVGLEIRNAISADEIIVWRALDMTVEEFNALELPTGWDKNQVRELNFDEGSFSRSPGASTDGPLVEEELFGFEWEHVATIKESGISLDSSNLLIANTVDKYHEITFLANRTVQMIISPEGERYVLTTRNLGRIQEEANIPDTWQKKDTLIQANWVIQLPRLTTNIRTDNQDSYQGPLAGQ